MSSISSILDGAAELARDAGAAVALLLDTIGPRAGWFDDTVDGGLGMVISGLAGSAAALLVAILLLIYFRTGYRSRRDIVTHGLAAALLLGLLAFAIYDMRHAAFAYLGLTAPASAVEFGIGTPPRARLIQIADIPPHHSFQPQ
jgi:hypothetical protein